MTNITLTPKRIQMSRQKPWRADNPDAVIVARPSKWGNPANASAYAQMRVEIGENEGTRPVGMPEGRRQAVSDFRHITAVAGYPGYPSTAEIVNALAGKDLACWCPLDQPCHADVLLEIANHSITDIRGAV